MIGPVVAAGAAPRRDSHRSGMAHRNPTSFYNNRLLYVEYFRVCMRSIAAADPDFKCQLTQQAYQAWEANAMDFSMDVTPSMISRLQQLGDVESTCILDVILHDEVG
jgi:uncharacterized ferritin-like protein (DUF455 family)